jgi:hypothetical protein
LQPRIYTTDLYGRVIIMVFGMIMSLIFLHFKAHQNISKDEESYVQVQ